MNAGRTPLRLRHDKFPFRVVAVMFMICAATQALEYLEPQELKNTKILSPNFSCVGLPIGLYGAFIFFLA
jgi:hypothetical protein